MTTALQGDDTIGAFISTEFVMGGSGGPLSGRSFAVKDLFDVAGQPTGFGNPVWRDTHPVPTRTASCIQALLDAGASLLGKTHTDELAYSLAGRNIHYGAPINVRARGRNTGGSSSGSVAAVAAELVDFAVGSDTGGSVRIPASLCGVFGIRTTQDRIPMDGAAPLAPSFDTCGWFARDIRTMRAVGDVLLENDPTTLTPARAWLPEDVLDLLRDAVRAEVLAAAGTIADALGVPLVHDRIGVLEDGLSGWAEIFRRQQGWEAWNCHGEWIRRNQPEMGPDVAERFRLASQFTEADYQAARAARDRVRERLAGMLGNDTVLVMPAAPDIALLHDASADAVQDFRVRAMRMTCIAGLGGLPQVVMPWMEMAGCPIGMALAGPPGTDQNLLALTARVAA